MTFAKEEWTGVLKDGKIVATKASDPPVTVTFERVERESDTLGESAPEGALVLFDGSLETAEQQWDKPTLEEGLLTQGVASKETFSDFSIHIEFRLPWMPKAR